MLPASLPDAELLVQPVALALRVGLATAELLPGLTGLLPETAYVFGRVLWQ